MKNSKRKSVDMLINMIMIVSDLDIEIEGTVPEIMEFINNRGKNE